jgi:Bacterial protein of unknown function (DUF937)
MESSMATNLVSLVMQSLTPDMVGRIATALGFDRNKIESAISSAVPELLAAFNGVATQPGGAQKPPTQHGSRQARLKTLPACLLPEDSLRSLIRDRSCCRR